METVSLIAGQLAESNERLVALSLTDPLTGVANRRRFNEFLQAEWEFALRTVRSIGVAII